MTQEPAFDKRIIRLTKGNLNNSHIYLSKHLDFFSKDVIGGGSRHSIAKNLVVLHLKGVGTFQTDIAGDKKIFRHRGPIRKFLELHGLRAGDEVILVRRGDYQYALSPLKTYEGEKGTEERSAPSPEEPKKTHFPSHGPIECRKCFTANGPCQDVGLWRITNDPGAWGSRDPEYLVLGFSKGFTQAKAYASRDFDSVAFARSRSNLKQVLEALGLLDQDINIDTLMTAKERTWAFGSLVRCSLARWNKTGGKWEATGPMVQRSFSESPASSYISNCTKRFLSSLPPRLKLGVLLGNGDGYIKGVKEVFKTIHTESYQDVNEVAFKAGGVLWVHTAHPSPLNGHLGEWLRGHWQTRQGRKAFLAIEAAKEKSPLSRRGSV